MADEECPSLVSGEGASSAFASSSTAPPVDESKEMGHAAECKVPVTIITGFLGKVDCC